MSVHLSQGFGGIFNVMMKSFHKRILRWVIIFSGSTLLIVVIILSITTYVEREIRSTVYKLNGRASSIDVNLFTRSVQIEKLQWSSALDSLDKYPHSLRLNTLTLTGISLYQFLVNKTIRVNEIKLDSGKIQYNNRIKHIIRAAIATTRQPIECSSIYFNKVETEVLSDSIIAFSALLNLHATEAAIHFNSNNRPTYSIKNSDGVIKNLNFGRHEGMYGATIKQVSFNTQNQKIEIDSVLLIPNFSKFKFAHYVGEQVLRLNISIPKITLEGVAFDSLMDSTVVISKILVQSFDSHSFKDKRILSTNKDIIPLPMESFLKLPWKIKIDSILISNSRITTEEFPAKGVAPGISTLDDVRVVFTGLNNRRNKNDPPYAIMDITGLAMNSGKFHASFQFPVDGSVRYHAKGSVSEMPFEKFNPVLGPIANLRAKSGYLNSLTFNFTYTELTSKGQLDIDYEDLRITSLNKNKQTTNDLRTLFVNAVIRNDRDQSGPSAKIAGIIDIERDRTKIIFNVWRISILDGLRSSILGKSKTEMASKKH
jgi:hypothetical protein